MTSSTAFDRLSALCARSEHCEGDIRRKLYSWGLAPGECEAVVKRLVDEGYVDNRRYARAFVHDKSEFVHWGRMKIMQHLLAKGLPRHIVDEALEQLDDMPGYGDSLLPALRRKAAATAGKEPRLRRAALLRLAASRGFEAGVAIRAVQQVLEEEDNDGEQSPESDNMI